jgi:hypothetical protein
MELNSNKWIVFSFNTRKILQVIAIIVIGKRIPELIHSIPECKFSRKRKCVSFILGNVFRSHAMIVEVDRDFLLSNLSHNIRRSL